MHVMHYALGYLKESYKFPIKHNISAPNLTKYKTEKYNQFVH